jgi:hypothetical protein
MNDNKNKNIFHVVESESVKNIKRLNSKNVAVFYAIYLKLRFVDGPDSNSVCVPLSRENRVLTVNIYLRQRSGVNKFTSRCKHQT